MLKAIGKLPWLVLALAFGCVAGLAMTLLLPGSWLPALLGNARVTTQTTVILERVQQLSQLTTTRYTFSNMVTSQRDMPPALVSLYGESLILVAVGYVTAGIDLTQLSQDDFISADGTLTVILPPPLLLDCFFDEANSYIVQRQTGVFARPSGELDNDARRYAIVQMRQAALDADILGQVQAQAADVMVALVGAFVDTPVQVVPTSPDPNAALPSTCGGQ